MTYLCKICNAYEVPVFKGICVVCKIPYDWGHREAVREVSKEVNQELELIIKRLDNRV